MAAFTGAYSMIPVFKPNFHATLRGQDVPAAKVKIGRREERPDQVLGLMGRSRELETIKILSRNLQMVFVKSQRLELGRTRRRGRFQSREYTSMRLEGLYDFSWQELLT